ncbi:hypothetical protein JKP88DRAFT_288427 [Tribonema minus]|uniref:Macrophage erythroblast attacher n=1 Tax=Tribonema minus TaxID=303371 RepID=A0A835ZB44_9STRA|nr:hypothetical protein JKP88DRAFT_288427 [Tribonema minus]
MELEGAFIRTPFECFNQVFRVTQKTYSSAHACSAAIYTPNTLHSTITVTRDLSAATAAAKDMVAARAAAAAVTAVPAADADAVAGALDALAARLQQLRAAVAEADAQQARHLVTMMARIEHLKGAAAASAGGAPAAADQLEDGGSGGSDSGGGGGSSSSGGGGTQVGEWERTRVDRWVADYLLQQGHERSARALIQETGLESLVDAHVYDELRAAQAALLSRDCAPALAWCAGNGSRLRRVGSPLEFLLRAQECLQLVAAGDKQAALQYATAHLSSPPEADKNTSAEVAERCAERVRLAMASLLYAGRAGDAPAPYRDLLCGDGVWHEGGMPYALCSVQPLLLLPLAFVATAAATAAAAAAATAARSNLAAEVVSTLKIFTSKLQFHLAAELASAAAKALRLARPPVLRAAVRCGLCALKTPACFDGGAAGALNAAVRCVAACEHPKTPACFDGGAAAALNADLAAARAPNGCPVCCAEGQELARALPYAHHGHSVLLCRISGARMDEANPPLALPNGQVYSSRALAALAEERGDGTVTCPVTKAVFALTAARPVYIL